MAHTLTAGSDTITPTQINAYEAVTESANIVHRHLDRSVGVSIGDDDPRSGTLNLLFDDRAAAWAAHALLRTAAVWTLESDLAELNMTFVRAEVLRITLDTDTNRLWKVELGFQEVTS